jgi:hypothetical protein
MTDDETMHSRPPADIGRSDRMRFSHGDGVTRDRGARLSSTTRYLSGAAYVDEAYAELVVDELVANSHRAVAPSLGYNITTVVRHCFRAQRLWLIQNAIITAILILGLVFLTWSTAVLFVLCVAGSFVIPATPRDTKWPTWKTVAVIVAVLAVIGCALGPLSTLLTSLGSNQFGSSFGTDSLGTSQTGSGAGGTVAKFLGGFVVVALAVLVTLIWSRHRMITTITTALARGKAEGSVRLQRREVEQRLHVIDTAQHGNIVLHAGYDPFIGAGGTAHAWSAATELRPDEGPGPHQPTNGRARPGAPQRVEIDPVELVAHIRQRLAALRSRDLPEHERITALQLRDQVISSGTRWHDFPLIDDAIRLPYSFATPDAIDAIIRSPQTSARHFLRATVGAADKAVVDDDGRTIMPAEHQSVVSSTYLHVAAEGGMLYVELVATVLGPIRQRYLDIDRYDGDTDPLTAAAGEAVRRFVSATASAPLRLAGSLIRTFTLPGAIHRADREALNEPVYDFGARRDIRQAASITGYANYLQRLDAEKYRRLIDRRATEAIEEFLAARGIDTSDFSAKVNFHQYNSTTIHGSAHGPVATGTSASATMTTIASAVTGMGKGGGS